MAQVTFTEPLDQFAIAATACAGDRDAARVEAAVSLGLLALERIRASATATGPLSNWREAAPQVLDGYRRWHQAAGRLLPVVRRLKADGVRLTVERLFIRAYMEAGRVATDFDRAADLVGGRVRGPGVPLGEAVDGLRDRTVRGGA